MNYASCEFCGFSCENGGTVCDYCKPKVPTDQGLPPRKKEGKFTPRPYQMDAVESVFGAWASGKKNVLLEMATGLGKTVAMAEVCLRWPSEWGRIILLAHRTELIEQARDKVGMHIGDNPEVEKANQRANRHSLLGSDVVVASVQTLTQSHRLERFHPDDFGLILTDEAHHATSKSYRRIFEHFQTNRDCKMLGVTATPERADKVGLIHVYDGGIVYQKGIKSGIDDGYLVPIYQMYSVIEGLDFALVRKVAGDFQKSDLEKLMLGEFEEQAKDEAPLLKTASVIQQEYNGKRALVFCVTKKHALAMAEILCRYPGVKAECVIDDTPPDERARIIERYQNGETKILAGVGVFCEGFDAPLTELVAICRPTKSLGLYQQMVGRGTRPAPGVVDGLETAQQRKNAIFESEKPSCRVLDFVGVSGQHSLVSTADIMGDEPADVVAAAVKAASKKGGYADMEEELEKAKKAYHDRLRAARDEALVGEAAYNSVYVDAFGNAMGIGPGEDIDAPELTKKPRGTASEKQVNFLVKLGIARATAETYSRQQAGAVITERKRLAGGKYRVTFGKHAGKSLEQCPNGYLHWMLAKNIQDSTFGDIVKHIRMMPDFQKQESMF